MTVTDQMGREVTIRLPAKRIVSLVPSQTELLFELGLDVEVVGITKFCVHPAHQFRAKPRVGGTKQLNFGRIDALAPDLIIGNKEENEREQVERLARQYPVWMSDIATLSDALAMIRELGRIVGRENRSRQLAGKIDRSFADLRASKPVERKRVAYFIWRRPYMVAAGDTFIHEMLGLAGFVNAFGHLGRYPEIELAAMNQARVDLVLLSSEPYPFRDAHLSEFREVLPGAGVELVDGELFSWYGSRLLHSAAYFKKLRESLG